MRYGLALCIAFLMPQSTAVAADRIPDKFASNMDMHRVYDVANLRLNEVAKSPTGDWIVAEVRPGLDSGFGIILPLYPEKPKSTSPGYNLDGTLVLHVDGVINIKAALMNPVALGNFPYDFTLPSGSVSERHSHYFDDHYIGTFARGGGAIVCRLNKEEGFDHFRPVYSIPIDWEPFVRPALDKYRKNGALSQFDTESEIVAKVNRDQFTALRKCLTSKNPYIRLGAFRVLAETGNINGGLITAQLAGTRDLLQAILAYEAIRYSPEPIGTSIAKVLKQQIGVAKYVDDLIGISLALLVAGKDGNKKISYDLYKELGSDIDSAFKRIDPNPIVTGEGTLGSASYLQGVLEAANIRTPRVERSPTGTDQSHREFWKLHPLHR